MSAFIYGLNDCDERVRAAAADEIGDQVRKNCCCCSAEVVAALTCALGDCDRRAVRQVEQALKACGYQVVDCCKGGRRTRRCCPTSTCCAPACAAPACAAPCNSCAPATAPAAVPAAVPASTDATAPAPPATTSARKNSLSHMLGYLN